MSYVVFVLCIGCIISIQCYVKIDSSLSINQSIFLVQWHVINLKPAAGFFLQFIVGPNYISVAVFEFLFSLK